MYTDIAKDHFAHPRNAGVMPDAQGEGSQENPACGDLLKVFIKVNGGRIADIRFQAFGCSATIASGSMITEMAKGKSLSEALAISDQSVSEALGGLPPNKRHCSTLAAETLHQAIEDYRKKL
ncbi:MAG: FeS cluster assembly scaffold protein NifU [Dehalococcoidia bacterium]|nr:FeS cluster assembly scaffold protein NifU [Dehalococcoidia bacterium]